MRSVSIEFSILVLYYFASFGATATAWFTTEISNNYWESFIVIERFDRIFKNFAAFAKVNLLKQKTVSHVRESLSEKYKIKLVKQFTKENKMHIIVAH